MMPARRHAPDQPGRRRRCAVPCLLALLAVLLVWQALLPWTVLAQDGPSGGTFEQIIRDMAALNDRDAGSDGAEAAARYVEDYLKGLGYENIRSHRFAVTTRQHQGSRLETPEGGSLEITPFYYNAITPETIPAPGLEGPLVYVGTGSVEELKGKALDGSIILMEFNSGKNWLNTASLGARALIFIEREPSTKTEFNLKKELSPLDFPIFLADEAGLKDLFGSFGQAADGVVSPGIRLVSATGWRDVTARNVYCEIPGTDPKLEDKVLIVEAFYDAETMAPGRSPGADQACGIATLLELARNLKAHPPGSPVMLVATSGHAQSLAGMREMIWSLRERSREMRQMKKKLQDQSDNARNKLDTLEKFNLDEPGDQAAQARFIDAISDTIKTRVDLLSKDLMRLRLIKSTAEDEENIRRLADERLLLRRLGWRSNLERLTPADLKAIAELIPAAKAEHQAVLDDTKRQQALLRSAGSFRNAVGSRDISAIISLHLSSGGDGLGAFSDGWLYALKPEINRQSAYTRIDDIMIEASGPIQETLGLTDFFKDTLRPSRLRTWQSYFLDKPPLGGEVSALAGYLGLTLVTTDDARQLWGTPYDVPEKMDLPFARKQSAFVSALIGKLSRESGLQTDQLPRNGFSTVMGRAKFIRHGELFPDQAAPDTTILAFQGPATYHATVDAMGLFQLKGMADKKHVYDKVIIEGYRFDRKTGETVWAIDKKQTGKDAYRVKMNRRNMETDLVMFGCRQTTIFNLLDPRSFRYMTRLDLIDARLEASPLRYWYSRIDTHESTINSIYLEPGTRLKLTLTDSVLAKKMILLNADEDNPQGVGYLIDEWPTIPRTELHVANDMWDLLGPRIDSLEKHGIHNEKIRNLQKEGRAALETARDEFTARRYGRALEAASTSWALAARVYTHVEKTQKDVLFGVLFYIALFVPFAFCVERFLFSYTNIHKRIVAFLLILLTLIVIIYNVHPAFQLAYSPTVVILAFFIMGLSLIVTLIIFFRFEEEMVRLQKRANQTVTAEISRWQAFTASFFLGVSNLRRRRLRTVLTCATLVILTFTIMSFTSVKSLRHRARIMYQPTAPYKGFLLKNANWIHMSPGAMDIMANAFTGQGVLAPRAWLDGPDRSRAPRIPVRLNGRQFEAQGMMGLAWTEKEVTGLDKVLTGGRWFEKDERHAILLPERMAADLGIDPARPDAAVTLWGVPFRVVGVFSSEKLEAAPDLDGEPLTPVIFPGEINVGLTDVEMEALESGEDVRAAQSRYQHIAPDLTVIIPYRTVMGYGGNLQGVAVRVNPGIDIDQFSDYLVDRFKLAMFIGEKDGTFLVHASDTLSYSGVPNIIIPILISVFIVLNTMIGSVYERKKEIGIYTSVGLAPSHVSFLFIAEAMAFAVLSVVLGYLFAQGTASVFAGTKLWSGITVNYSSLAGVAAMLLIFLVVLISVIYPSRVAARIAIPDVNRSWTLPEAEDNMLSVSLPMLLKFEEARGIGGFIYHYLQGHQDVSHGIFSTGQMQVDYICDIYPDQDGQDAEDACKTGTCHLQSCLHFQSKVWLAPFDFGIMQRVEVEFCPSSEDPGYLGIKLRLIREAGEANIWRRINKAFINQLRKQVLIWRSLTRSAQANYEMILEEALKKADTEEHCDIDPEHGNQPDGAASRG